MLSREKLTKVLEMALSTGGDFAEIFVEDTTKKSIKLLSGKVEEVNGSQSYGVGIRIFKDLKSMYAYTNNDSLESLLSTAKKAADALGSVPSGQHINLNLIEKIIPNIHPIQKVPSTVDSSYKIELMKKAHKGATEYSDKISQVMVMLVEDDQKVQIANSTGLLTTDRRIRTRFIVMTVASDGADKQESYVTEGGLVGFELVEGMDLYQFGADVAKSAITMLEADYCPAGKMPVAIDNGFGGVIFHEACGHSLEASSVAEGNSIFCGKLGEQIANEKVTAIDDGTMPNEWGSLNIDDEGNPTKKNILIENGILKSYMIDMFNGRKMNKPSTGSGRRESYKYAPTSRMTNTFIAEGTDKNEDIIASIDYGLYAKKMGGGSVNPLTGDFNFAVTEGYIVRDGKICEPVRGASLIGNGANILMDIDMVGQNFRQSTGMCGASSGWVPTNVGQPMIRVKEITVGGRS
ncbi:MAG: peptidase C69 [Epulopiscium sp. Nele67-Bin004]|nr:MAG: peptidase C69 [Epulopiscium sp. Nele67-Bin004]